MARLILGLDQDERCILRVPRSGVRYLISGMNCETEEAPNAIGKPDGSSFGYFSRSKVLRVDCCMCAIALINLGYTKWKKRKGLFKILKQDTIVLPPYCIISVMDTHNMWVQNTFAVTTCEIRYILCQPLSRHYMPSVSLMEKTLEGSPQTEELSSTEDEDEILSDTL